MGLLAHYTERATKMNEFELHFAIIDVRNTMRFWKHEEPSHPYVAKLLAEFAAYTVEIEARRRNRKGRSH